MTETVRPFRRVKDLGEIILTTILFYLKTFPNKQLHDGRRSLPVHSPSYSYYCVLLQNLQLSQGKLDLLATGISSYLIIIVRFFRKEECY